MTEEQRDDYLYGILYDFTRWKDTVKNGALGEDHQNRLNRASDTVVADALAAISWALGQKDLDFQKILPSLLRDRSVNIAYLEIVQRELLAIQTRRGTPGAR